MQYRPANPFRRAPEPGSSDDRSDDNRFNNFSDWLLQLFLFSLLVAAVCFATSCFKVLPFVWFMLSATIPVLLLPPFLCVVFLSDRWERLHANDEKGYENKKPLVEHRLHDRNLDPVSTRRRNL
jgi:hypothetical protein